MCQSIPDKRGNTQAGFGDFMTMLRLNVRSAKATMLILMSANQQPNGRGHSWLVGGLYDIRRDGTELQRTVRQGNGVFRTGSSGAIGRP